MPAHTRPSTDCVTTVTGEMAARFHGRLSFPVVAAEVEGAERDLRGQIAPAALAEMLHRLAEHRLQELASAQG